MSACFTPSNSTDVLVLVSDGVLSLDGSVIVDGSVASGDANGNGADGAGGGGTGDATMGTNDGAQSDGPVSMPDATVGKSDVPDGADTVRKHRAGRLEPELYVGSGRAHRHFAAYFQRLRRT